MKIFTKEERAALDRYSVEEEGVSVSELINRFAEGVTAEVMKRLRPGHSRAPAIMALMHWPLPVC